MFHTTLGSDQYAKLKPNMHIRIRPDMYLGSHDKNAVSEKIVYDPETDTLSFKQVQLNPSLEQCFKEVLTNAADAVRRSQERGINPIQIEIEYDGFSFVIRNYGLTIPIVLNKEGNYVPYSVFGEFMSGSNFDDSKDRFTQGRNGYGVKNTNALSKYFNIMCVDMDRGLSYNQTWMNGMEEIYSPEINTVVGNITPSVTVTFILDYEWFGVNSNIGLNKDQIGSLLSHALIVSRDLKIPVLINGKKLIIKDLFHYMNYFFPKISRKDVIYSSSELAKELRDDLKTKDKIQREEDEKGYWEIICIDTPNQGKRISSVNATFLPLGGNCVDDAYRLCIQTILTAIKEKDNVRVTKDHISPHITIFFSCIANKPTFTSQDKSFMVSPKFRMEIPPKELDKIKKWEVSRLICSFVTDKKINKAMKEDKGKVVKKHIKANNWKHSNRSLRNNTILAICEGDSAIAIPREFQELDPDNWGIFSLHGKIPNVFDIDIEKEISNQDLSGLRKVLNIPLVMSNNQPLDLYYGNIIIMTDSDPDGAHIASMLLLFFALRAPYLFCEGRIYVYISPAIRAHKKKGNEKLVFYSEDSFEQWRNRVSEEECKKWDFSYIKGLASNEKQDIRDEIKKMKMLNINLDDLYFDTLTLSFSKSKEQIDRRKEWIKVWMDNKSLDLTRLQQATFSDYLGVSIPVYIRETLTRALPYMTDGFVEVRRKILFTVQMISKTKNGKIGTLEIMADAYGKYGYGHGDKSINDTIGRMNFSYPGTNNIALLFPKSIYGSRYTGTSKLSAARYTSTSLADIVKYIFRKEDEIISVRRIDSGKQSEYETYFPIVPMHLINGVKGVAMAFSTYIPSFHPIHIIWWIKTWLNNQLSEEKIDYPFLRPWFKGFNGIIRVEGTKFFTEGIYQFVGNELCISELPIGTIPNTYVKEFLETIEGDVYQTRKEYCSDEKIDIRLSKFIGFETKINDVVQRTVDLSLLKLINQGSMNNMTVLYPSCINDGKVSIRTYNNVNSLMKDFCTWRLNAYQMRKDKEIEILESKVAHLRKKRLLVAYLRQNKEVLYLKRQERDRLLLSAGFENNLLKEIVISMLAVEAEQEIEMELNKKEKELEDLKNYSIIHKWFEELNELEEQLNKTGQYNTSYPTPGTDLEKNGRKNKGNEVYYDPIPYDGDYYYYEES